MISILARRDALASAEQHPAQQGRRVGSPTIRAPNQANPSPCAMMESGHTWILIQRLPMVVQSSTSAILSGKSRRSPAFGTPAMRFLLPPGSRAARGQLETFPGVENISLAAQLLAVRRCELNSAPGFHPGKLPGLMIPDTPASGADSTRRRCRFPCLHRFSSQV